jgi:hypothetical protein
MSFDVLRSSDDCDNHPDTWKGWKDFCQINMSGRCRECDCPYMICLLKNRS